MINMIESIMPDFQLKEDGICSTCNSLALEFEFVQCTFCKNKFHAVCSSCTADDKWATKSMISMFKAASTKRNFNFLCNNCLTAMETNMADYDGIRMRRMEENMERIGSELLEIKKLVARKDVVPANKSQETIKPPQAGIWFDRERLASVKAKPAESVLVLNKAADSTCDKNNFDLVENTVVESQIPVTKSYKDKSGNHVVICDSVQSRDALKEQVSALNNNIEMKTPKEKRPIIPLVRKLWICY